MLKILNFIILLCFANWATLMAQDKRIALVIGNGKYLYSGELANPVNDARSMKAALQKVGFEVYEYENLNQSQMKVAIDDFGRRLKNFNTGLFFYAGHGIQAKGYNYLIPVDANLSSEQQVEYDCVQADRVLALMEAAGSKVNIVILDACRNNPFERSWSRSTNGGGLAFMNAPSGSLIAYATSPGRTASDGSGSNGLYTYALLQNISQPNITILQMFQNVRRTVSEQSNKQQIPWESTSLTADFFFTNNNTNISSNNETLTNTNVSSTNAKNKTTLVNESVYWRHGADNTFWFYKNGESIGKRVISAWSDEDLVIYDPISNSSYLLKNYTNSPTNQDLNVQILGINENAFWRRSGDSYYFYYCGDQIAKRTTSVYTGDDVLAYDPNTNSTFIFENYKNRADNVLRTAKLLDNSESVFWRKKDQSYWLYVKGSDIQSRTTSGWVDNDLLVYDKNTNTTYLLKDYGTQSELKILPAQVISYIDNVFWMKKDNLYYFYINGEQVAKRTTNKWNGNDLLVTDTATNLVYVLQNYANAPDKILRPAVLFSNY